MSCNQRNACDSCGFLSAGRLDKHKEGSMKEKPSEIVGRWRERTIEDCARVLPVPGKPGGIQATIRHAIGLGSSCLPGMGRQGLIVIFLSSHLAWSKQTLTLPPTSQAGIKVKGNGMLELTAGKAHSA